MVPDTLPTPAQAQSAERDAPRFGAQREGDGSLNSRLRMPRCSAAMRRGKIADCRKADVRNFGSGSIILAVQTPPRTVSFQPQPNFRKWRIPAAPRKPRPLDFYIAICNYSARFGRRRPACAHGRIWSAAPARQRPGRAGRKRPEIRVKPIEIRLKPASKPSKPGRQTSFFRAFRAKSGSLVDIVDQEFK